MSRKLLKRRAALRAKMESLGPILQGSVTTVAVRCGHPNCKCTKGEKHSSVCLSAKRKGKTKMVYLGQALAPKAREWVNNCRELMQLVQQLSDINTELLKEERSAKRKQKKSSTRR